MVAILQCDDYVGKGNKMKNENKAKDKKKMSKRFRYVSSDNVTEIKAQKAQRCESIILLLTLFLSNHREYNIIAVLGR